MEALQDGDPRQAGPYRLTHRLGGGGMGQVFLGSSPGGRPVAVKMIRPDLAREPDFRRRFAREVGAARKVGGFYTAQVVGADPDGNPPWMATAYIPGPSLSEAVACHGPLREDGLRILGAGVAEGLAAVHGCGLVHRDLKPGNVILADDGPRVIDFGIARALDASTSTKVIGTPGFMSPEQIRNGPVGTASDVFCLGAVLVYAATGSGPFGAGRPDVVLYRIVHEEPDLRLLGGLPYDLVGLLSACLAKDPAARPPLDVVLERLAAPPVPLGTPGHGLAASDLGLVPGDPRVLGDRQLVLEYLSGRMTYEEQPWMFDDDVLMFAVARLWRADRRWVVAQVASGVWPESLRRSVAVQTMDGEFIVRTEYYLGKPRHESAADRRGGPPVHGAATGPVPAPPPTTPRAPGPVLHYAAASHRGLLADVNQDCGYAGPHLLAVADGGAGRRAGNIAAAEVVACLVDLDGVPSSAPLTSLHEAAARADRRLRELASSATGLDGLGTTLTAMYCTGGRAALLHIGDSRAYLLRDDELFQITRDHTAVQRLLDEGRITDDEAAVHPERSIVTRLLTGDGRAEPDVALREIRPGDRYLFCTDGVSDLVGPERLYGCLATRMSPADSVAELIQLALRAGGPDNATCVVADVVAPDDQAARGFAGVPVVVGAADRG
ncbi:protein kinase domain-containing protein [Yinghuangia seranimata]|uniref:protein kinase domain-containing protein n=1 Tax=Yinghuangia seranimata TaxID=408067 RepID=UPI00248B639D|nr:protein kinase [Yinghuangia seranimata]MDI2124606.1 protein kinase [Yinghuangia seranimata]